MNENTAILEVMLELAEEENTELKSEIEYLQAVIKFLEYQNKELKLRNNDIAEEYNNLTDITKRLN
jgi:uncharacterized protein (DUF3084 family)